MQTTSLGPLTVSRLALGTMLMGGDTPVDESHRILDRFVDAGGTLIDTADTYGDGRSERTLAPWLAQHRDEVGRRHQGPLLGLGPRRLRASRRTASARPATRRCGGSGST